MRSGKKAVADEAQLVREKIVGITTGDNDILDYWIGGDVGEGFFPAGFDRLVGGLGYGLGVTADGVGACAVAAVETTD